MQNTLLTFKNMLQKYYILNYLILGVYIIVYNNTSYTSRNNFSAMPIMDFPVKTAVTSAQLRNHQILTNA